MPSPKTVRARRLVLSIKSEKKSEPWEEEFFTTHTGSVGFYGTKVVEFFDEGLRPHESARTFVSGVDHGYVDVEPRFISHFNPWSE